MKPLIVFDIDGTLTATIEADDHGFIQTYKDLYKIDLGETDWSKFNHVTDLGVSNQIFQDNFKCLPTNEEINSIKTHFLGLLKQTFQQDANKFIEVSGAVGFFNKLKEKDFPLAIATGGWRETALFKLEKIGLKINDIPFANSKHHYSRSKIIQIAIESAKEKHSKDFERIIYFGDGKWDLLTCQEMGIEFIGVDFYGNGKLKISVRKKYLKILAIRKIY
ncbi:MAG: HAD family hydrolase [Aridibacter sp.]